MRRARPKSYVLATSTSLPETEHPMAFSQDDSRELSSLGSMSSIDRSSRTVPPHHVQHHGHRIQKFIALFRISGENASETLSHFSADQPESVAGDGIKSQQTRPARMGQASAKLVTHISYSFTTAINTYELQELALGKTGKRRMWEECWAVLFDQSLYLCSEEPRSTVAENTGEKLIHLPPCARVDVHSSIIDIAYEWLAMSRTKHVIRIVTQTRAEHLFELDRLKLQSPMFA
ncbi:unnamed protein product [Heligmosomoides polygyrus]|uniref:PH domain-containing protein n=1 Tax=Heligmosomoides polygyrus TaxID=6339 RepID=A0A3P8ARI2_HELPZ|nr:unnamed protein product [Heligmosomoides polygyrus]